MDTSETYSKMRVKAIPDLGMGVPPRVIPYNFLTDTVYVDSIGNFYCMYQQGKDDAVIGCQLERQDQLQEMVESEETKPELIVIDKLAHFAMWERYTEHYPFTSREQLELAFVMKERYNKTWTGEGWA